MPTDEDTLRAFLERPPTNWGRRAGFMYRQAVGTRQAAEQALLRAQQALAQAQTDVVRSRGYEAACLDHVRAAMQDATATPEPPAPNGGDEKHA